MNNTLANKLIAWLTLISGLSISAVAVYYSVSGLTAIFAAAVVPIVVMGITLEVSKLVATVWLKLNWKIAPLSIKSYLIAAIVMLMLITSMGIFGFLSQAHADRSLVTGDAQAKVDLIDERIKTVREKIQVEKDNISLARNALSQMDAQVIARLDRGTNELSAERSVQIRRQQARERTAIQNDISTSQDKIEEYTKDLDVLTEERIPFAAELRKVEAEVGPIKYIATFIYGETNQTLLEKAVVWVILLLITVFDPLAIILLLASQHSFQKLREETNAGNAENVVDHIPVTTPEPAVAEQHEAVAPVDNPIELWNSMIKAAESEASSDKPIETPPVKEEEEQETASIAKDLITDMTTSTGYVQNEEQRASGRWKEMNRVITEKEYLEATEKNIDEMVQRVRNGILPFYKVPYEIQDEVKKGLDNASKNNSNNPS